MSRGGAGATLLTPGKELDYADTINPLITTSAAPVDFPGLAINPVCSGGPIMLHVHIPTWRTDAAIYGLELVIREDNVIVYDVGFGCDTANGFQVPANAHVRRAPAAGAHAYKVQCAVYLGAGTQTLTCSASANVRPFITATSR